MWLSLIPTAASKTRALQIESRGVRYRHRQSSLPADPVLSHYFTVHARDVGPILFLSLDELITQCLNDDAILTVSNMYRRADTSTAARALTKLELRALEATHPSAETRIAAIFNYDAADPGTSTLGRAYRGFFERHGAEVVDEVRYWCVDVLKGSQA